MADWFKMHNSEAEILQCVQLVIKQEHLISFLELQSGIPPRSFLCYSVFTISYLFLTFHKAKVF